MRIRCPKAKEPVEGEETLNSETMFCAGDEFFPTASFRDIFLKINVLFFICFSLVRRGWCLLEHLLKATCLLEGGGCVLNILYAVSGGSPGPPSLLGPMGLQVEEPGLDWPALGIAGGGRKLGVGKKQVCPRVSS